MKILPELIHGTNVYGTIPRDSKSPASWALGSIQGFAFILNFFIKMKLDEIVYQHTITLARSWL